MNPTCSRCDRIVYPTEKLNCLDKYWHKGCFRCEICQMTLNMKNYKGFDKKPYCNAHYPTTRFTAVADTPENLRLKKQTLIQSQIVYKGDFEKNRGKAYSQVVDTPEFLRLKKSQEQISNVKYHEEQSKKRVGDHPPQLCDQIHEPLYNPPRADVAEPVPLAAAAAAPPSSERQYRAIYDYTAADDDEVSFADGDVIVDVRHIDVGWMYGRVERTGQQGMLPANYVEAI